MSKDKSENTCNVPDCDAEAQRRGVCEEHEKQNYVLGCTVDGCKHEVYSKGRCRAHYMRQWRKKNGKSAPPPTAAVRRYGLTLVATRIPEEDAEIITKASGRPDGLYEKAGQILSDWAKKHAA